MIIVDMMTFAMDNPGGVMVLISGDRDFVYCLSILRNRKFKVILVVPDKNGVHVTLRNAANVVVNWRADVLNSEAQIESGGEDLRDDHSDSTYYTTFESPPRLGSTIKPKSHTPNSSTGSEPSNFKKCPDHTKNHSVSSGAPSTVAPDSQAQQNFPRQPLEIPPQTDPSIQQNVNSQEQLTTERDSHTFIESRSSAAVPPHPQDVRLPPQKLDVHYQVSQHSAPQLEKQQSRISEPQSHSGGSHSHLEPPLSQAVPSPPFQAVISSLSGASPSSTSQNEEPTSTQDVTYSSSQVSQNLMPQQEESHSQIVVASPASQVDQTTHPQDLQPLPPQSVSHENRQGSQQSITQLEKPQSHPSDPPLALGTIPPPLILQTSQDPSPSFDARGQNSESLLHASNPTTDKTSSHVHTQSEARSSPQNPISSLPEIFRSLVSPDPQTSQSQSVPFQNSSSTIRSPSLNQPSLSSDQPQSSRRGPQLDPCASNFIPSSSSSTITSPTSAPQTSTSEITLHIEGHSPLTSSNLRSADDLLTERDSFVRTQQYVNSSAQKTTEHPKPTEEASYAQASQASPPLLETPPKTSSTKPTESPENTIKDNVRESVRLKFLPLIRLLNDYYADGIKQADRSAVACDLKTEYPRVYEKMGFTRWRQYSLVAEEAGVIKLGTDGRGGSWVRLSNEFLKLK
jgi:hypothetical protein